MRGEEDPVGTRDKALLTPDEALAVLAQQQAAQAPSMERVILRGVSAEPAPDSRARQPDCHHREQQPSPPRAAAAHHASPRTPVAGARRGILASLFRALSGAPPRVAIAAPAAARRGDTREQCQADAQHELNRAEEDVRRLRQALDQAQHRAAEARKRLRSIGGTRQDRRVESDGEDAANTTGEAHDLQHPDEICPRSPDTGSFLERWVEAARQNIPNASESASIHSAAALLDSDKYSNKADIVLAQGGRPWSPRGGTTGHEDVCHQGQAECFIRLRSDCTVGTHESILSDASSVNSQPVPQRRLTTSRATWQPQSAASTLQTKYCMQLMTAVSAFERPPLAELARTRCE